MREQISIEFDVLGSKCGCGCNAIRVAVSVAMAMAVAVAAMQFAIRNLLHQPWPSK